MQVPHFAALVFALAVASAPLSAIAARGGPLSAHAVVQKPAAVAAVAAVAAGPSEWGRSSLRAWAQAPAAAHEEPVASPAMLAASWLVLGAIALRRLAR